MTEPVLIDPEAFYDDRTLRRGLGITSPTLSTARRSGALRFTRKGNRVLYLGAWVLACLEAESLPRRSVDSTSRAQQPKEEATQ